MLEYFVIIVTPIFPFTLPKHSWVGKRSKDNKIVLPSRREAVVDPTAGAAEHTLHPISCECCCYVRSYSAAFVKNLTQSEAKSAPTAEHLF